jgi:2-methylcitrate dehydratase
VDFPIGHRRRRAEGIPLLVRKFEDSIAAVFPAAQCARITALFADSARLDAMPVGEFVACLVKN